MAKIEYFITAKVGKNEDGTLWCWLYGDTEVLEKVQIIRTLEDAIKNDGVPQALRGSVTRQHAIKLLADGKVYITQ
jgi:hypothetical protein